MNDNDTFERAGGDIQDTVARLRKQKWPEQYEAIGALKTSSDPLADRVLLQLLDLRSPNVREAALDALATRSKGWGRLAARAMLADANCLVRNTAAEILGEMGNRQDVRRLRRALADGYWVMRATVADSLGQIGGKAVHPELIHAMIHDPHPVVRRDAAYALAYAQSQEVVPDLERALRTEKTEQARVGLLSALLLLGQRERLPELLTLLDSEDCQVLWAVINALRVDVRPEEREQVVYAIRTMLQHEENPGLQIDGALAIAEISGSPARN